MEEAANHDLVGVGDRIRQARQEAGLTQNELSDLIGVGMRQIQYYESGESNPYRTLRRIAEATGKSMGWLLHGEPVNESTEALQVSLVGRLEELAASQAALLENQRDMMAGLTAQLKAMQRTIESLAEALRTAPRRSRNPR